MLELIGQLLRLNNLERGHYAEPFAGGCGLALALLYGGHVAEIHINDIDRSIWAFWHAVLKQTDKLVEKIERTEVSIDEWRRQRDIHRQQNIKDTFSLGFSTFFLNRTNRSGIIKGAGVIGGLEQNGNYKLDCRYNKTDLIRRILRIAKYTDRINLYNLDALEFLKLSNNFLPDSSLLFIDPPYFNKGADLYTSFYKAEDHGNLASAISKIQSPWIVTYDTAAEIMSLYKEKRQFLFDLSYSVQTKRMGTELLIASENLKLPDLLKSRRAENFHIKRSDLELKNLQI